MRTCPACQRRLSIWSVLEPTRLLTMLCRRCWATLRINPQQFVAYTVTGGLFGIGVVVGFAVAGNVGFTDTRGLWSLVVLMALAAGRFFPALEVEDPPLK